MHSTPDEASGHVVPPSSGQSLFEAEHLPFPPVPLHLASLLRPDGSDVFSTRPLQETPYNLNHFLDEFETDSDLSPYAVVGFDGMPSERCRRLAGKFRFNCLACGRRQQSLKQQRSLAHLRVNAMSANATLHNPAKASTTSS